MQRTDVPLPSAAVAVLIAVATALLLVPASATAERVDESALSEAREKVRSIERELSAAEDEVIRAEDALAAVERRLAQLEEAVNEAAEALERQEGAVAEAVGRVEALEGEIDAQQEAFSARAADMYKRGVGIPFSAVLDAASMDDALERSKYVQALSQSDQAALESIVALRTQVDAERELLEEERDRLAAMKAEQEELLAEVAEVREHRAMQVAEAQESVDALESHLADAQAESRQIEQLIEEQQRRAREAAARAAAEARASGAPSSNASGAGHIWPRCDAVTSEYGRRWGRMHYGLDIDGNTGHPVFASKDGTVIYAGWQGGYGRLVLVDHHDGVVTAYAHLSAFSVGQGQQVSQGQRVGSVGSTGNSTGPHLHFETRVNGSPVNPRRYLPSGC